MLRYLFFLFFIGFTVIVQAQILDDSTKLVYGPNTTKYITEDNILYNDLKFTVIDTSAINSHRWSKPEKTEYKMQDLGVSGTAIRNIYYKLPDIIGARSGYSAYVPYYKSIKDFRYYDTNPPIPELGQLLGGKTGPL
jgi:ABC-type transport system involved in multi-copper enzyme maturation permease subunit